MTRYKSGFMRAVRRHRWLAFRRCTQLLVLGLFLAGPYAGIWVLKGNLASSTVLGVIDLSDPFIALQSLFAGHRLAPAALWGALTIVAVYVLFGGRSFCAWVCPINPVTDLAAVTRRRFQIKSGIKLSLYIRLAMVPAMLLLSFWLGEIAFEAINPITVLHRGLLFGLGAGWIVIAGVFVFDLFVVSRGWCGHICPVGAFYGLIGRISLTKVRASRRDDCTQCGDCFQLCPEPHVIAPALFPKQPGATPIITSGDCITCGKCIDVCDEDVFEITHRFRR